jgi:hypothetical protein
MAGAYMVIVGAWRGSGAYSDADTAETTVWSERLNVENTFRDTYRGGGEAA